MLTQIQNFRFYMRAKFGERGVAMTEYAILLAFVAAVAAAFVSDQGLGSAITGAVSSAKSAITKAGTQTGGGAAGGAAGGANGGSN